MSLFEDDVAVGSSLRKRGSLYKFSWVEEQQKSLQFLQERSLEKSSRRRAAAEAPSLHLEEIRASRISRSVSRSSEGQPPPPSTSPELAGPSKRQSVKLSEGEVDPLSAIMNGAVLLDAYGEDEAQTPPPSSSERPGAASVAAVDLAEDDGEQESNPDVLRRAKRLVFSLTIYLAEV